MRSAAHGLKRVRTGSAGHHAGTTDPSLGRVASAAVAGSRRLKPVGQNLRDGHLRGLVQSGLRMIQAVLNLLKLHPEVGILSVGNAFSWSFMS